MDDVADSLYILSAGASASLVKHAELKVELLDTSKSKPTDPARRPNDVSIAVSVVYKIF